ncbi:hypothetical protein AYL99_11610 [Fonsecaea erecta]|uniref:Uncharacterized protein n=1 Tax=Fonsecaea erecta TaxID=1367422 RepID=A0A178Z3N1_9EURO|nr:hypothetical protein AYL99_11610 [Fonsecaea erecta]OAP54076.1 hypothetical protein AYL99_11610 [Fonsecaea erecta]
MFTGRSNAEPLVPPSPSARSDDSKLKFVRNHAVDKCLENWYLRRDLFRPLLSAGLVPGKVLVLDTGCGDEDECVARVNDTLQSSLEFHTLLAEVEAGFETMANDDGDEDDGEGCDGGDEKAVLGRSVLRGPEH